MVFIKNETTPHTGADPIRGIVAVAAMRPVGHDAEVAYKCLGQSEGLEGAANGGLGQIGLGRCRPQGSVRTALPASGHVDVHGSDESGMGDVELKEGAGDQSVAAGELGALDLVGVPGIDRPGEGNRVTEAADLMDVAQLLKLIQSLLHGSRAAFGQSPQLSDRLADGIVPAAAAQHGEKYSLGAGI